MPDFALYDQSGKVVQSARFRGKQIMLNFIFTRCPVATMCPASTLKMMQAQRLAREAGVSDIEFVSITLDPTYDTPGVLKEYAEDRGIDTSNFSFLTGPEGAVRDLLTQFGVVAEFEGDLVKHTLATLLIDPPGHHHLARRRQPLGAGRLRGADAQRMKSSPLWITAAGLAFAHARRGHPAPSRSRTGPADADGFRRRAARTRCSSAIRPIRGFSPSWPGSRR